MGFNAAGSNIPTRISFNSGTLDFGTSRLVMVENLNLSTESSIADIYVLGSIIAQDKVRHTVKVTLSGKIKSFAPELEVLFMGSSTVGTPNELDMLDGQPTLQNPVLTMFDRNGKQIQYQFTGALFKSSKLSTKAEDFAEWDFELEAKTIAFVYTV
jgi:hypothetical protein